MARQLLTVDEASARLNVAPRFVRRLISERRVPFVKLGRHVRLDAADIDELVERGRVEPPRRLRAVGNEASRRPPRQSKPARATTPGPAPTPTEKRNLLWQR